MVSLFAQQRPPEARGSRWRRGAAGTAFSVVAHLAVLLVLLAIATEPPRSRQVMLLPLDVGSPDERVTPYLMPAPAGRPVALRAQPTTGLGAEVLPEPQPVTRPSPPEAPRLPERVFGADSSRPAIAVPPRVVTTRRLLRPGYGDGRLWVPPIDVLRLGRPLPAATGPGVEGPRTVAQLDSTVTSRLRAFLDTMPRDSFAPPAAQQWTTEIAGQKWGIDRQWIYLGPLKLPAALLALLPINLQGNIDQSRAANELLHYREDIMQAARRAETAAEFKRYVNELRKRKDQEREARRKAARDTVIP